MQSNMLHLETELESTSVTRGDLDSTVDSLMLTPDSTARGDS